MILSPLPDEHIYSYLYRSYKVHSIDGLRTIVNPTGQFKQRLASIKLEYIKDFVPMNAEEDYPWWYNLIGPVLERSGFRLFELNTTEMQQGINGKIIPKGIVLYPFNKTKPDEIKFCPECTRGFIRQYGTVYLVADWLNGAVMCNKHGRELISFECNSRKMARYALSTIYTLK